MHTAARPNEMPIEMLVRWQGRVVEHRRFPRGEHPLLSPHSERAVVVDGPLTLELFRSPQAAPAPTTRNFDLAWLNLLVVTLFTAAATFSGLQLTHARDINEDALFTRPLAFQTTILRHSPPVVVNAPRIALPKVTVPRTGNRHDAPKSRKRGAPRADGVAGAALAALDVDGGVGRQIEQASRDILAAMQGMQPATSAGAGIATGSAGATCDAQCRASLTGTIGIGAVGTRSGTGHLGKAFTDDGGMLLQGKPDHDISVCGDGDCKPEVRGSLDKDIIRRVVRSHMEQVRYCYQSELQRSPGLAGKISMNWIISDTGRVLAASPRDNDMGSTAVASCLAGKIKTWIFPKPNGGGVVDVNYPFVFRRGG